MLFCDLFFITIVIVNIDFLGLFTSNDPPVYVFFGFVTVLNFGNMTIAAFSDL